MSSPLDLLGVTSLLGGEIAKGAIRYINANPYRCFTSFLVIPGLYDVSSQMLKRSNDFIARILSPGEREDKRVLVGLKASNIYKYIGMNSGTTAYVCNALCEGWLNRKFSRDDATDSRLFVKGQRGTVILKGIIENSNPNQIIMCNKDEQLLVFVSVICQLGSIAAFAYIIYLRNAAGIAITAVNMISSFAIYVTATSDIYRTPSSKLSPGVPAGNSLITDITGNDLCVILGNEEHIQNFIQKEVYVEDMKHALWEVFAPIMGIATTIATILLTPLMPTRTQLFLAVELLIGLVSGILFSSRDGNVMLEKIADKYYSNNKINITTTKYTNRATALAAVIIETKGKAENLATLLPKVDEYGNWEKYIRLLNDIVTAEELPSLDKCECLEDAIYSMCKMFPNSAGGLCCCEEVTQNINTFKVRLIIDVIEAIVESNNMQVKWKRI